MPDKDVKVEPLFRCNECNIQMFSRDCERHMLSHQRIVTQGDVFMFFTKGVALVPSVPGSLWQPRPKKKTSAVAQR